MAYFAPHIDADGLHMPTYDDRLEELWSRYCEIFGVDPALSGTAPDYQLLSAVARSLDETSGLIAQVYDSRNPVTASGYALDLLMSQYGLTREKTHVGEKEDRARVQVRNRLAARGGCSYDSLFAAVRIQAGLSTTSKCKIYVNDNDAADNNGIPGHSVAVVAYGGYTNRVAQAIYDHVAPGVGTYGSTAATAYDSGGNPHTVNFTRPEEKLIFAYPFIRKLAGADEQAIENAIVKAVTDYLWKLPVGGTLYVPQLYGVMYTADPSLANTFAIRDIQACFAGDAAITRDVLRCDWNQMFYAGSYEYPQVTIHWMS